MGNVNTGGTNKAGIQDGISVELNGQTVEEEVKGPDYEVWSEEGGVLASHKAIEKANAAFEKVSELEVKGPDGGAKVF